MEVDTSRGVREKGRDRDRDGSHTDRDRGSRPRDGDHRSSDMEKDRNQRRYDRSSSPPSKRRRSRSRERGRSSSSSSSGTPNRSGVGLDANEWEAPVSMAEARLIKSTPLASPQTTPLVNTIYGGRDTSEPEEAVWDRNQDEKRVRGCRVSAL